MGIFEGVPPRPRDPEEAMALIATRYLAHVLASTARGYLDTLPLADPTARVLLFSMAIDWIRSDLLVRGGVADVQPN